MINGFEQGEVNAEIVHELRVLATRGADVPELVRALLARLGLDEDKSLLPVLVYFRAAFDLSLRSVLPLREWLGGKDRSEVDSILIPAMQSTKDHWQDRELQRA